MQSRTPCIPSILKTFLQSQWLLELLHVKLHLIFNGIQNYVCIKFKVPMSDSITHPDYVNPWNFRTYGLKKTRFDSINPIYAFSYCRY